MRGRGYRREHTGKSGRHGAKGRTYSLEMRERALRSLWSRAIRTREYL